MVSGAYIDDESTSGAMEVRAAVKCFASLTYGTERGNMKLKVIVHEAEEGGYWAEVPAIRSEQPRGASTLLRNIQRGARKACRSEDVTCRTNREKMNNRRRPSRLIEMADFSIPFMIFLRLPVQEKKDLTELVDLYNASRIDVVTAFSAFRNHRKIPIFS